MPANAAVEEERLVRFHDLDEALAACSRGEAAASVQNLHESLAASACVWGYRKHRMIKNAPGDDAERVCSRCGYGPVEAPTGNADRSDEKGAG